MIGYAAHHDHLFQLLGVGGMIAAVDVDEQIVFGDVVKDGLSVKTTIVVTYTGVIAAHDQVGATHVLAEYRMEHGFFGTGVEHVKTVSRNQASIGLKVQLNHLADGGITDVGGDIALFQFTKEHVDDGAVGVYRFHGHLGQALMGAMHGVTGLKGHDRFPTQFADFFADLGGGPESFGEFLIKIGVVQHLDGTGDTDFTNRVKGVDAGMIHVLSSENALGHFLHLCIGIFFDGFHILNGNHGIAFHIGIQKGNTFSIFNGAGIFHHVEHGGGPEKSVCHVHVFGHGHGVGFVHKTGQRIKVSGAQHHGITRGSGTDDD